MGLEKEIQIPVECSECGHESQHPVSELHLGENRRVCPGCGVAMNLTITGDDPQQIASAARDLDRAIDGLGKSMRKFRM